MERPNSVTASEAFRSIHRHGVPGYGLATKLVGGGAIEVEANGAEVVLSDGRRFLDFGSYAVNLLGHRHPAVIAAVAAQLAALPTSSKSLANGPAAHLAERLVAEVTAGELPRAWFGLNGCDVVELALKLSRLSTGRSRVLALEGGFHGKSLGALAVTHSPMYRAGLGSVLVGTSHIPPSEAELEVELARGDVAALILEPVQGEGGAQVVDPAFIRRARALTTAAGAHLIADEVQAGLGRCGPLSAVMAAGVVPDALLLGKPLGGGVMPLSAALCSEELFGPLRRDPFVHTSTFSGHPLSCAAGLAAIDAIRELLPRGEALARQLDAALTALVCAHPEVLVEVRGAGLLRGVTCTSSAAAGWLIAELGPLGLLVSPCLGDPTTIRLLPPLVTSDEQLRDGLDRLGEACAVAGRELAKVAS